MRPGKLKMKRYPVQRRGGWAALLVLLGIGLGAGAATLGKQAWTEAMPRLIAAPRPAVSPAPESVRREERTLTLPGHTWYALQLGVFDGAEAAESLAASFRGRGAAGYVRGRGPYRVLAAAYAARADAQAVITQLRSGHQVDAVLTEITQPEVTLRLTGRADQLTALSDACGALEQLSIQLSSLSAGLDRGGMDRQQAVRALQSHRDTLNALKDRLNAQFGQENAPEAVKTAAAILGELSQSLADALTVQGTAALGGRIKYAQLQCLCRMADYAAGLAE